MKYYESTSFFLRVILVDLINKSKDIQLKLLPMFHIGEERYYKQIQEEAGLCDIVLHEGLKINKLKIDKQIGKYFKAAKALNMISQYEYFKEHKINTETIHTDLSGEIAEKEWRNLKCIEKLKYRLLNPIRYRMHTHNLTREKLSKAFMTRAEETHLAYGPVEEDGTLEHLIKRVRDDLVISKLDDLINAPSNRNKVIGVMYGAGHMKRIGDYLTSHLNFRILDTKFAVVYSL